MPKLEYTFEIEDCANGDKHIRLANGYDPEIRLDFDRRNNWWIDLFRTPDGDYVIDVQIGNHNAVLLDANRDGLRGVDEDRLEVAAKNRCRIQLLAKAVQLVKEHETRIIYAMEHIYTTIEEA